VGRAYFTGTGFPTDFMIRYHLYCHYFPMMALGRYREAIR
jgi:squalene-hopene/tetraprenyl-beta-curcumene cyclase